MTGALSHRWDLVPFTRGKGLQIACGPQKLFEHFILVDRGPQLVNGYTIRPDVTADAEDLSMFGSRSLDFIVVGGVSEDADEQMKVLQECWRLLKVGGHLVLMQEGAAGMDLETLGHWSTMVRAAGLIVLRRDQEKGNRHVPPARAEKTCAVIRYGAFGDLMMASSIFPLLKAQGYHVTLYTTPTGEEVVRHDPNIDAIIVQDKDQVPNGQLVEFWDHLAARYDKFINLSESVEGVWLALPGRSNHRWPHEMRHRYLNRNYLEFTHELAGVEGRLKQTFHPTTDERAWARTQRDRMGKFVIMWSLAGSSVHKTWPYLDEIIARTLIEFPNSEFVLVGDHACQLLEQGWENEPRVHCRSGKWSIRQSLTFTEMADLLIGPETGVMNAAANLPVKKIVTLSHSSVENLTKHWINTFSLVPKNTGCFPCHRLHYGFEHCNRDETTGTAACQADISADQMWEVMVPVLERRNLEPHFAVNFEQAVA